MNQGNEKVKIIAALLVQLLVLANLGLSVAGKNPLPFISEKAEIIISSGLATGISIWNMWKNRNVTTAAQKGQEVTNLLKNGVLYLSEVDDLIKNAKE